MKVTKKFVNRGINPPGNANKNIKKEKEMKESVKKLTALLITAAVGGLSAYAGTEEELLLGVKASPTISIEKNAASYENDTVNVETGRTSGNLKSVFTLQTNGTDDDYDLIMTSTLTTDEGTVSAYGLNGGNPTLLFGNLSNPPTSTDVTNAKAAGNYNCNVIAYPISLIVSSPVTATYRQDYSTYGDCVVVKLNGNHSASVMQMVHPDSVAGTYVIGQDTAGTYKAIVTFTAYNKL